MDVRRVTVATVVDDRPLPHAIEPLLLHHHHHLDGGLRPKGYARPDEAVARVNASLVAR